MQNELEILKWVEKNQNTSQREISQKIGISVGNVNVIINRLIKNGMIEMERIDSSRKGFIMRTRYIITKKGLKKKTEEIYKNIIDSYKFINKFNSKVELFFNSEKDIKDKLHILYGLKDELFGLIEKILMKNCIDYKYVDRFDELNLLLSEKADLGIYTWQPECMEVLIKNEIKHRNVLEI